MLDDRRLVIALTEILSFARSGPTVDKLIALFTSHALAVVDADRVDVHHRPQGGATPRCAEGASGGGKVAQFPVSCGRTAWGELHLSGPDGAVSAEDLHRGRLLAEVLGAALATSDADPTLPEALERYAGNDRFGAPGRSPDDLVALVMECAEALDGMPNAPTRSRLALVVGRLATTLGSASWSVAMVHKGRLYELSRGAAGTRDALDDHALPDASVKLARFPARLCASEGWAFYADHTCGDAAERRVLTARGCSAVLGAGGYDPDGRSWVVQVHVADGDRVSHITPVLAAVAQAALSFPRGADVPLMEDPRVRAVLGRPTVAEPPAEGRGLGQVG